STTRDYKPGGRTPTKISIVGQLTVPHQLLAEPSPAFQLLAYDQVLHLIEAAGYRRYAFGKGSSLSINLDGITAQSPNLNDTTQDNKFADSCVVYGHYIAPPHGIDGTFPSLAIAHDIDKSLDKVLQQGEIAELRPDGKVHVTVEHTTDGFKIRETYLSVATQKDAGNDFPQRVIDGILENTGFKELKDAEWKVNSGGKFDVYFLAADYGMSKAKDGIIITGGLHQLGTDAVWGKCLYKASSTLIPYVFALSRVVCEVTGARYASVGAFARYGQAEAELRLQEIEPRLEQLRQDINAALAKLPLDRDGVREVTGMPVTLESYRLFNEVHGFHSNDRPWKKGNRALEDMLKQELKV
ncbi:MAG: hypothetical protein AABX69_02190, partial [Nanoarchaeota archaeon]